jgi:hypothetical protein
MNLSSRVLRCESEKIPGRANHTIVALNNDRILVCGGEDDDIAISDTWIGKVGTESVVWERVARSSEFEPRYANFSKIK